MIPQDLESVVKTANKKYNKQSSGRTYKSTDYQAKFFPLSAVEILSSDHSTDDGSVYWYYEHDYDKQASSIRKKMKADSVESTSYWLRSPTTHSESYACYIHKSTGSISGSVNVEIDMPIAPAFVI